MNASLAHSIALKQASKPILAKIKETALNGQFGLMFTDKELTLNVRKHLEHLGYEVKLGGSGLIYYVFW